MILQTELFTNEFNLRIITIIVFSCLIVIILIVMIFISIKQKIYWSYHKGYRHANKEAIRYYETLETIIKRFDNILSEMKSADTHLSLELTKLLFNFKGQLREFQEV